MLGKRSDQKGLWEADRLYLDYVGKDTFYGLLASLRGQLFSDDDFAEIYCPDNGRDSVPPSLLATALLLQTYDKVSDAEAKARADFDIRWKVALGIEIEDRPFAKSTLQMFRAQLILHDKVREVFEGSLRLARQSGYLKKRGMRVALDTTYILGRGAVKDTCNLLADGIVKLLRVLAAVANATLPAWAEGQGYEKYFGSSIKGEATIDWSDRKARAALLGEIVADADRLRRDRRARRPRPARGTMGMIAQRFRLARAPADKFHETNEPATHSPGSVGGAGGTPRKRTDRAGRVYRLQAFQFDGAACLHCAPSASRPKAGRVDGC